MFKRRFPMRPFADVRRSNFPFFWDEDEDFETSQSTGLSVYEDKNDVVIEAALPGLSEAEIEVTHDHGYLLIDGEKKEEEEDPDRKYYRRASRSFCYRVAIPSNADESQEPEAIFKDGMMKVKFSKGIKKKKNIPVKKG